MSHALPSRLLQPAFLSVGGKLPPQKKQEPQGREACLLTACSPTGRYPIHANHCAPQAGLRPAQEASGSTSPLKVPEQAPALPLKIPLLPAAQERLPALV